VALVILEVATAGRPRTRARLEDKQSPLPRMDDPETTTMVLNPSRALCSGQERYAPALLEQPTLAR
jgi:hypothetical protein